MGGAGERRAVKFLKRKGYKIIQTNFSCRFGEIDIIAQKKGVTVFVEVKTRTGDEYGRASESITAVKKDRIRKTAEFYLYCNDLIDCDCRFDVIAINNKEIEYLENAF